MNYFITKDVFLKNNTPSRTLWVRFKIFFYLIAKHIKPKLTVREIDSQLYDDLPTFRPREQYPEVWKINLENTHLKIISLTTLKRTFQRICW